MTMTLRMKTVQIYEADDDDADDDDDDDDAGDDCSLHYCVWWINKWPKTKLSANTFAVSPVFFKIFQVQETETMAQRLHRNRETAFMKAEPFPSLSFPSFLFGSIGGPDSLLHWCLHRFGGEGWVQTVQELIQMYPNVSELKRRSGHWGVYRFCGGRGCRERLHTSPHHY